MAEVRNALTSGVLDPLLSERYDLKQYEAGLEEGINIEFLPQGGVRNRAGHAYKATLRNRLDSLNVNAPSLTATVNSDIFILAHWDQGQPQTVACIDLYGYKTATKIDDCTLTLEYSPDNAAWTRFGLAFGVTVKARTRRFSPGTSTAGGATVEARYWRIVVLDGNGAGAFSAAEIRMWSESTATGPVKIFGTGIFELVVTDRNIDVFEDGLWQTAIPGDATADQLPHLTFTQELDTVLLFHPDIQPVRLKKQENAHNWNHDFPAFANYPDDLGHPRCGTFYHSRLVLGGFAQNPDVLLFSVNGDPYDFNQQESDLATDAIKYRIDSGFPQVIHHIFVGRHLQIFTDEAEWYIDARTIDATQPLNVTLATRHGIAPGTGIHFIEGSTVFVQRGGTVLRDFLFSDAELSYKAEAITLLASHLLTGVVDIAVRRAAETSEGNLVFIVNADGTMTLLTLLRSQSVVAAARILTDGFYRAVDVDDDDKVWLTIERTNKRRGGSEASDGEFKSQLMMEQWSQDSLLDSSVTQDFADPATTISGLDHLEGQQVWSLADGNPVGPHTVTGGSITLKNPASVIDTGLFPQNLTIRPMPLVSRTRDGKVIRRKKRIHTVWLSLQDTGDLSLSCNGGPARPVPLRSFGDTLLDTPMMDDLFTGEKPLYNRKGCSYRPTIEITRTVPAPLLVRGILMEVG